ncbi:hypothetical protein O988_09538 [Pseudogymnoascus sp. VKM F-3808]|nr:hypothetical protein O988_09538 [Pseudogymnoascus sp. VKM F-3808]
MDAASNAAFRATSGRPSNGAPDSTPAGDVTQTPTPHSDIIASILATEPDWRFQTPLPTTEEAGPAIPGSQDQSTAPGSDQGDTGTNHNGCTCQTTFATAV